MCTWFGTCSALGARMRAHGLVYPLFVAQSTWFGMPDVCRAKVKWVEHGTEGHEVRDRNKAQVHFRLGEEPMGDMKLLLSKGGSMIRGEVGGVGTGLGGNWRLEVLGQSQDLRQVLQLEWVMVVRKRDVFILKPVLADQTLGTSEVWW